MRDKRNQKTVQKFLISAQFFDWPVMGSFFVSRFDKEPFMGQIVIGAVIHHAFQGLIDFLLQLRIIIGKGNRKIVFRRNGTGQGQPAATAMLQFVKGRLVSCNAHVRFPASRALKMSS